MIKPYASSTTALSDLKASVLAPLTHEEKVEGFPAIVEWCARLRLLERVPFAYLVPDDELLPSESIRFFYLNRNWTDRAVEGALSTGAPTTRDRAHLQAIYPELRTAVDAGERRSAHGTFGDEPVSGPAEVVTGFLLRSRAVSGWPGLHVRGFATRDGTDDQLRLLRVERLAPAVLLVLMDGVPARVEIEEPRTGIQFGVDLPVGEQPEDSRWVRVRDPADGEPIDDLRVRVSFRADAPGVVDMTALRTRLLEASEALGGELSSAELALQLLQFPFVQEFGGTAGGMDHVLRTSVPMEVVRQSARMVARL